jgi:thiol-disulfide isomerase/thioredoxin
MGRRTQKEDTTMHRITSLFILLTALAVFAEPSEKLPLTEELNAEEMPWFAFSAKDNNGTYKKIINREDLKELAKQKKYRKVVFAFFATWCTKCREGLEIINDNAEELKNKGILVVLVNVAEEDIENYNRKSIDEWLKNERYIKADWLLVFDRFSVSLKDFGLQKGSTEAPLPRTLIADSNMRPLMLIGAEGDDYLQLLLKE